MKENNDMLFCVFFIVGTSPIEEHHQEKKAPRKESLLLVKE